MARIDSSSPIQNTDSAQNQEGWHGLLRLISIGKNPRTMRFKLDPEDPTTQKTAKLAERIHKS